MHATWYSQKEKQKRTFSVHTSPWSVTPSVSQVKPAVLPVMRKACPPPPLSALPCFLCSSNSGCSLCLECSSPISTELNPFRYSVQMSSYQREKSTLNKTTPTLLSTFLQFFVLVHGIHLLLVFPCLESRYFWLPCSLLYPLCSEWCLAHSRYSISMFDDV